MNDSLNICLPCGLCCEGILMGFVELSREELPVLRAIMDIEEENGYGFFLQPCMNYCNGCSIYSKRPKNCADFKCGLLKSVEQKELDFDAALEIINMVKQRKSAIEEKLALLRFELKSQSFYFKMVELKKIVKNSTPELSLKQNYSELMADIKQFEGLLLNKFGISNF